MGRAPRIIEPGLAYHVLNRRVMRMKLFAKAGDYLAFEAVLAESLARPDAPHLMAWCLMPNHWHLVVKATRHTNLSTWMQWVTVTHTHRWHAHTNTAGEGPLYQGRFKSFPIQQDSHFLAVCRYVEANAKRAHLAERAEAWRWGSLSVRRRGQSALKSLSKSWPVARPRGWSASVNGAMEDEEIKAVQQSIARGTPMGQEKWKQRIANRLGLDLTLRPRGRPRKAVNSS